MHRTATTVTLGFTLALACSAEPPSPDEPDSDAAARATAAPFSLVPAGDVLVFPEADVWGVGRGTLIVFGEAIVATGGELSELHVRDLGGTNPIWLAPEYDRGGLGLEQALLLGLDAPLDVVEARAQGLALEGFTHAVLVDRGMEEIDDALVVDAASFAWRGDGSRIEIAAGAAGGFAGSSVGRWAASDARHAGEHAPPPAAPPTGSGVLEHAHEGVAIAMGEPCATSDQCDADLSCTIDPTQSGDEMPRCWGLCVAAPPTEAQCVDDLGCCDETAICDDAGQCIAQSSDGGDDGGSNDGDGCNCDRDDDGVANGLDANPDESCRADSDNDGCKDSCDGDDGGDGGGAFGCRRGKPRGNSLLFSLGLLAFTRGRRRRR